MKTCNLCKVSKTNDEFHVCSKVKDNMAARCKPCHNLYYKNSSKSSPSETRDRHLRFRYGITSTDYDTMYDSQGGVCYICKESSDKHLHVDHSHTSGLIRKLLCRRCNQGLGQLRDDVTIMQAAINYIKEHQ